LNRLDCNDPTNHRQGWTQGCLSAILIPVRLPTYVTNTARNVVLSALGRREQTAYYPITCCYLVTYRCDLRCGYCLENDRVRAPADELDTEGALKTLAGIRACCDVVDISGGEPLLRQDLAELLAGARRLGFSEIVINTNAIHLPQDLRFLSSVHRVVVGLDAVREEAFCRITGGTTHQFQIQMANLERLLAAQNEQGYDLNACIVLLDGELAEAERALDWCFERGMMVSVSPHVDGLTVHEGLRRDPSYRKVTDRLVQLRRRGGPLLGSVAYHEGIRDLSPFDCVPMANLTVSPLGELFWPCGEIQHRGPSFVEGRPYREMVDEARRRFGPMPRCRDRCHFSCRLPLSTVIHGPWRLPGEVRHLLRYRRHAR